MFIKPYAFCFKKLKFSPDIILASQSPRRKELISKITDNFVCIPADIEEKVDQNTLAERVPVVLAKQKAEHVASQNPNNIVLGCDTVVILNNKILGKPHDSTEAYDMLSRLSGNKHIVVTGCCIVNEGVSKTFSVVSEVWFKKLSDNQINEYIKSGDCFDKAGGYGIQSGGKSLVKKYKGDYFNIVGFPIKDVKKELLLIKK
ncbi:MAG: septum formation protein Maf [Clostridia bacterium]|nr:septum formation protein Maf [Clostridia bacterium]